MKPFITGLILLLTISIHGQKPLQNQASELYETLSRYQADNGSLNRFYYMYNSPERRERFIEFYNSYLAELNQFSFSNLSQGGKVDYLLFKRDLQFNIARIRKQNKEYAQVKKWVSPGEGVYPIERIRRRGTKLDAYEIAGQITQMNNQILDLITQLKEREPF